MTLDFGSKPDQSAKAINSWVAKETRDKIKDLVSPQMLTSDTAIIMVNGIYFKVCLLV